MLISVHERVSQGRSLLSLAASCAGQAAHYPGCMSAIMWANPKHWTWYSDLLCMHVGVVPVWENVHAPPGPISLHQDCNVFVSESDAGQSFELALGKGRQAYLLCIEGAALTRLLSNTLCTKTVEAVVAELAGSIRLRKPVS